MLYSLSIAAGACLLFLVQPMSAKMLLPWYGGAASVWITCLMFFQTVLFAGYAYAHWLQGRYDVRKQASIHILIVAVSALFAIIMHSSAGTGTRGLPAAIGVLLALSLSIGLQYFILSTTSPLMQRWYSAAGGGGSPYKLYSLSNAASLSGLLVYPFLIERIMDLQAQELLWRWSYAAFALISILAAFNTRSRGSESPAQRGSAAKVPLAGRDVFFWVALPALSSVMLMSTTDYLTQKVASFPLLWVVPLALYLLSFVICFKGDGWYSPGRFAWINMVVLAVLSVMLIEAYGAKDLRLVFPAWLAGLFGVFIFCHGELARRKPPKERLTQYYLFLTAGGALGGIFVAIVAPAVFADYYELPLGMLAIGILMFFIRYGKNRIFDILCMLLIIRLVFALGVYAYSFDEGLVMAGRNFYGTLKVIDHAGDGYREFAQGNVTHGIQFLSPARSRETFGYYAPGSGIQALMAARSSKPQRVGIVGLGAGSLAVYGRAGETYRFYEIDPEVADIAGKYFTFMKESSADIQVVIGDGRISLQDETDPARYDIIVIDAFSGSAIPIHLLTTEAMELYLSKLSPGGTVAFNISNRYLDLAPVVGTLGRKYGMNAALVESNSSAGGKEFDVRWLLLGKDDSPVSSEAFVPYAYNADESVEPWTDSRNNLLSTLKVSWR